MRPDIPPPFELVVDGPFVLLRGEVDLARRDDVRRALQQATAAGAGAGVTVDLAGVTFLDSAGLSILLRARTDAVRAGSGLHVVAMSKPVHRLLEMTGTLRVLTGDADAAL